MWTRFMDMHSGGGRKLDHELIFIEAPQDVAIAVFKSRFGRDPYHETCNCCGQDFSVQCDESIEQVTAWDRGCDWSDLAKRWIESPSPYASRYMTIEEFLDQRFGARGESATFVFAEDIDLQA